MENNRVHPPGKAEPRFFYGYIVVVAAFLIMLMSFGIHTSFGVFFKPMIAEFGWTRAVTSGAFSLSMALYGVLSIVMGGLNDRFGPRIIATVCGFFLGLGYVLMLRTGALWQLYLFFGVMTGIGLSSFWGPLLSTVARWFTKRRGLMSGVVVSGVGIGGLIAPPILSRLIDAYDWRLSYVIIGGAVLLVVMLAAQFLRRDPSQKGQMPYGEVAGAGEKPGLVAEAGAYSLKEAAQTPQFWIFFMIFFCRGFVLFAVMVHIVPHAIELGIPAVSAANVLAVIGGVGIVGNLAMGSLGDRIGFRWINIVSFILLASATLWLVPATELRTLLFFAAIFGFGQGGMSTSGSPLLAGLFGLGSHGLIFGVVGLGFRIGAALGPIVAGYIFDVTGSYQTAFQLCIAVSSVGVIMAAILRPTKRLGGRI